MTMNKLIKEYSIITIGTFFVAFAVYFFMIPSNVIVGSISGLSVVLARFIPIPISVIMFAFNAVLLVVGFIFLGKEFGAKTVYSSMIMPVFLYVFEWAFPNNPSFTGDILIDTICYLLIVSIGQAMLFHINASSGGMDVIAKLLHKYLHVELGKAMTLGGVCIAVTAILIYDTKSFILGLLATYANGIILDNFINGFNRRKRVCILSDEYEKVQDFIVNTLKRGVTLYKAVGGFKKDERIELITILTRSEYATLMNFLHSIDDNAFVTVSTVNEVIGNWSRNKRIRG